MGRYNAHCPYCGEEELSVSVTAYIEGIPVNKSGYEPYAPEDGTITHTDVEALECVACKRQVPLDWLTAPICDKCELPVGEFTDIGTCKCNFHKELVEQGIQLDFLTAAEQAALRVYDTVGSETV